MKILATVVVIMFVSTLGTLSACGGASGDGTAADARIGAGGPDAPVSSPDADTTGDPDADTTGDPDANATGDPDADATGDPDGRPGTSDLVINEVVKENKGTNKFEYIEIKGAASTDYAAYWVLAIESDETDTSGSNSGRIERAYQIGVTDDAGYWDTGFLDTQLENGAITFLLVKDFSGSADPLTGTDIDTDDDGTVDATPWAELVDAIGFANTPLTDFIYGIDAGDYEGASRIPDGTDTDMASDWTVNVFHTASPISGDAKNTRGAVNELVP